MAEHFPRRPAQAARRASESAVQRAAQAEAEQVPEVYARDMAQPQSLERFPVGSHRLAPRRPQAVRGGSETMLPAPHLCERGGNAPAVRVEMDLDLNITLQARIKGEIELSIL
ncbi:hypothetical protein C8A05DRAFT_13580 [Staphylotrichum tortipilum]|uniref:Uncharacterized protein n=1 Tax=Staphylotrichum tortipilum TaxID=2831512 RepID=A0AAN6MP65_9PEZI|nr:hypothetical protein C8A05DRAFT_13580 [Staphylotrichum longicolle]